MDIIEKILRHCDLWIDPRDRGSPAMLLDDQSDFGLEYVDCEPSHRRDGLTRSGGNEA